jgi:thioredoxin 1
VDFWAAWCPPCRALEPTIEDVAQDTRGSAVVAKVNVDEAGALAQRYAIRAIPTIIIFKGGKEVDRIVGVHDAATLIERLDKAAA